VTWRDLAMFMVETAVDVVQTMAGKVVEMVKR